MVTSRKPNWQMFVVMMLTCVLGFGTAFAASSHQAHQGSPVDRPLWLDKLENQIDYEEMMEGNDEEIEEIQSSSTVSNNNKNEQKKKTKTKSGRKKKRGRPSTYTVYILLFFSAAIVSFF